MCGIFKPMFNYQARWDRELPQETGKKSGMPIAVISLIKDGRITPRLFSWNNNTFKIKKVNFFWKDKQGEEELLFFSVETDGGTYQIVFSSTRLSWHMDKLINT